MPSSKGSPRPRDQTWVSFVSCISRQILYCWATKEALECHYFFTKASISHTHRIFCEHWHVDDHNVSPTCYFLYPPLSLTLIYLFWLCHQALFFCWLEYIQMQTIMNVLKIQTKKVFFPGMSYMCKLWYCLYWWDSHLNNFVGRILVIEEWGRKGGNK